MNKKLFLIPLVALSLAFSGECVVCIDVGHSNGAPGATSATGITEYLYNKRASIDLFYALKAKGGISPFFSNPDEKRIKLGDRVKNAKAGGADVFVSMHHDSVKEKFLKKWKINGKTRYYCDKFRGFGVFISPKNPQFKESLSLAKYVGSNLVSSGFIPSTYHSMDTKGERKKMYSKKHGIYRYDNLVVLKRSSMPAILIENGVILNREEEANLNDESYRSSLIDSIANGIEQWCRK